jgi:hypothetical protein
MECRRAFENFMRNVLMPGKLGKADPLDYVLLYAGWLACWRYIDSLPEEISIPNV